MKFNIEFEKGSLVVRDETLRLLQYASKKVWPFNLPGNISVLVKFRNLDRVSKNVDPGDIPPETQYGCYGYSELDIGLPRPSVYNIHVNTNDTDQDTMILTVFHELVHVIQHKRKWLIPTSEGYLWHGHPYSDSYPYEKQPWEVQAYRIQSKISTKYGIKDWYN